MEAQAAFPTTPLYRPDQVESAQSEIKALEEKLQNKHIEDKGEVGRQLRRARRDFESQVPLAPTNPAEEDRMVKRSRELLDEILVGMPSQEEMRKAPSGAVDKHRAWERRNKARIMEWKHIALRLTAGSGDREAASLEKHRPVGSTLNMDSAQITGKAIYLPPAADGLGVAFSAKQVEAIRALDPDLADRLGSLTNRQRGRVKDIVEGIGLAPAPTVEKKLVGKRGRKPLTAEQKQALLDRLAKGREAKAQKAQQG